MDENITIRGYEDSDDNKIIELLKVVFKGWPQYNTGHTEIETFNWKFGREMSRKTTSIAEDNGKIVGAFPTWVFNTKLGNSIYLTSNGCDVAVDPKYRGLNLFTKLRDQVSVFRMKYDVKAHLGISATPIVVQTYERNTLKMPDTWIKFPYKVSRMRVIFDVDDFLKKYPTSNMLIKKIGYKTLKKYYEIEEKLLKSRRKPQNINMIQVNLFDEKIDDFWERIKNSYDFKLEGKKEYLNWRYCDPRAGYYRVTQVEEGDRVIGYSVLRINRIQPERPRGYVVELISETGRLDVVDALLEEAMQYFKKSGINIVSSSQFEGHPYLKVYKKCGFVSYAKDSMFLWLTENLGEDINIIKKTGVERIHTSYGDEDDI